MTATALRGLAVAAVCALALPPAAAAAPKQKTIDVQLLALNDFHGNLEPTAGTITMPDGRRVPAGGAEYLATHLERLREGARHSVTVSAGDLVGASPLISALFHDEPTIESMNALGLDFNAVGNHEFDEGASELERLAEGDCHPTDGCQDGDPFAGADFGFLAANVIDERAADGDKGGRKGEEEQTLFAPYAIRKFRGEKVAFVGMTLEGTPSIVTPAGVAGLSFRDEAATVNALVPELRRRGAETIVAIVHEGGVQSGGFDECKGISGSIVDIVERTSDEVDMFITGHTHQAYNCLVDGRPVTSASSFGRVVTEFGLTIDRRTGEPVKITRDNRVITQDVPKDEAQTRLINKYSELSAPIANRVIGTAASDLLRAPNAAGESALGDVIADAQLAATEPAGRGDARIALMNPGGIRADVATGEVTYAEAFSVQPFGNSLVTMTLTGSQVERLLEQQFEVDRVLQVSDGFTYTYDASRPVGDRVDPSAILLDGAPISSTGEYRLTVNSFLADGGDGFSVLKDGTDRLGGAVDVDALEAYFEAESPVEPGPQNRITRLG